MIAPTQYRKPENWQDFEKLCKKLWGEIWNCSATIQRNGRSGQNQKGVDVYGFPKGENGYYGIQCKGKDDYTKSQLTTKEIDREIEKALNFEPRLKCFIFATTANKDVEIEEYIRKKNLENIQNGLFEIYVSSWEDIVDLLEQYQETYNWYVNNCQYKNTSDVDVYFSDKSINPKYTKTITTYELEETKELTKLEKLLAEYGYDTRQDITSVNNKKLAELISQIPSNILDPYSWRKSKINRTWCHPSIIIKNIGNTTISDFKLILTFDKRTIIEVSDCFYYCNDPLIGDVMRADINRKKDEKREVYKFSNCDDALQYKPSNPILVQKDIRSFTIGVKPKQNIEKVNVLWKFLSRDFHKEGFISIPIHPIYIETNHVVKVDKIEHIKAPIIEIQPLIEED